MAGDHVKHDAKTSLRATTRLLRETAGNPHGYVGCLPKNTIFGRKLSNSGGQADGFADRNSAILRIQQPSMSVPATWQGKSIPAQLSSPVVWPVQPKNGGRTGGVSIWRNCLMWFSVTWMLLHGWQAIRLPVLVAITPT